MSLHPLPRPTRRPTVSVVVPCYRYGHFLVDAVRSAVSQPDVETEVIVVDDASPDDSPQVVRWLAERYPQVTGVVHQTNQGHIATYNDGIGRAGGEYLILLSADDQLAPGALARATAVMTHRPEVGLVYGFAPDFDQTPHPTPRLLPHYTVWDGADWIRRVARSGQNPVCTPTAVMRRDLVTGFGGYDPRLPHTADLLMWLRSAAQASVAYISGVDQAYYRVHGTNMHVTEFAQLAVDLEQRREAFRVLLAEHPGLRLQAPGLLVQATQALALEAGRARRQLSPTAPGADRAAQALAEFIHRYAPDGSRASATGQHPLVAPSAVVERIAALRGKVEWRYWRRFGLRL